jgi:thioredoxin-dependent peroxiredoxin
MASDPGSRNGLQDDLSSWSEQRAAVGSVAPDFTLPGTDDRTYRLSDYRGRPVVLAFYPADNTAVCTAQLVSYTKAWNRFEDTDAHVFALSPQTVASHERFAEAQGGFSFPLLADVDKAVGRLYGVVGPLGFYRRSVFVLDAAGVITYAHRSPTGLTYRSPDELIEAIEEARGT